MVKIVKKSGRKEEFSEEKVRASLRQAGVAKPIRDKILKKLKPQLHEGMTTTEIYRLVYDWLREERNYLAASYDLKQAIMALGPTGYPFEKFLAGILARYDYEVDWRRVIEGECVEHEIDIVACGRAQALFADQPSSYMIECKFHNRGGIKTDVKDALYIYARFLDVAKTEWELGEGQYTFDYPMLATNTKLTGQAKRYCRCRDIKMLAWDYPKEHCLARLVEGSLLQPTTCLTSIGKKEKQKLLQKNFVFCRELQEKDDWQYLVNKKNRRKVREEVAGLVKLTYGEKENN